MNKNLKRWKKTRTAYVNWLAGTPLRLIFSKSIRINKFSLWWITKLVDKDIILNNAWYHQLNSVLNNEKPIAKRKGTSFPFLIAKVIKKFILVVIANIAAKIFYKNKNEKDSLKINCFHTTDLHFVPYKKIYLDHQYGLATLKNKEPAARIRYF